MPRWANSLSKALEARTGPWYCPVWLECQVSRNEAGELGSQMRDSSSPRLGKLDDLLWAEGLQKAGLGRVAVLGWGREGSGGGAAECEEEEAGRFMW